MKKMTTLSFTWPFLFDRPIFFILYGSYFMLHYFDHLIFEFRLYVFYFREFGQIKRQCYWVDFLRDWQKLAQKLHSTLILLHHMVRDHTCKKPITLQLFLKYFSNIDPYFADKKYRIMTTTLSATKIFGLKFS